MKEVTMFSTPGIKRSRETWGKDRLLKTEKTNRKKKKTKTRRQEKTKGMNFTEHRCSHKTD